jgi:hypothetical protein
MIRCWHCGWTSWRDSDEEAWAALRDHLTAKHERERILAERWQRLRDYRSGRATTRELMENDGLGPRQ